MSTLTGGPPSWELATAEDLFAGPEGYAVCLYGRRGALGSAAMRARLPVELREHVAQLVDRLAPGDRAASTTTWTRGDSPVRVCIGVLPEGASRHDPPSRAHEVTELLRAHALGHAGALHVCIAVDSEQDVLAYVAAVTRALPSGAWLSAGGEPRRVTLAFELDGAEGPSGLQVQALRDGVADAMRWHDTPCAELGCDAFVQLAQARAAGWGVDCEVIRGEDLRAAGLHGIWSVGRAAAEAPALVVLRHRPSPGAAAGRGSGPGGRNVVWVGKGVVFDTGGLSLKRPREMLGMKGDMGGAAAVLAAFGAAVQLGAPDALTAILCIAENAIGPHALRPDDILRMHSGKTVEVVDTDCEGRLLLADGVSYAATTLRPDMIVDLATLTDGAPVATGRRHAALVCNDGALEGEAVAAGRGIGEPAHPLPYAPEQGRAALSSSIADLVNAAPTGVLSASTAGQFIAEHLGPFTGPFLHIDLEGPSRHADGRATGYGVGLLLRTFGYL